MNSACGASVLLLCGLAFTAASQSDVKLERRTGRVLVVANATDPASLELAWEYMRARHLPPANLLRIPFPDPININPDQFHTRLVAPVDKRLQALPGTVDFIVLVRGVPYRIGRVSVPSALVFRGPDRIRTVHPYYQREHSFDGSVPMGGRPLQLATMITGYDYRDTSRLIKNSLVHYPSPATAGTFYFCEGVGARGIRTKQIDQALLTLARTGARGERVKGANVKDRIDIIGQFTGAQRLKFGQNRYLPGSIIDNMTSFGGYLLDQNSQMSILTFIHKGACGAYGTVSEPTNSWGRWADYSLAARYAAGFTLAESYYQVIRDISLGIVVGDPLMAPFAKPPVLEMTMNADVFQPGQNPVVRVTAREGKAGDGVSGVQLWLDGQLLVHTWQPVLPPGTKCGWRMTVGNQVIAQKAVAIVENSEPMGNILNALSGSLDGVGQAVPGGRNGNKLLLYMPPAATEDGKLVPAVYDFVIEYEGDKTVTRVASAAQPLVAHCAVIDIGTEAPQPGDRISITIKGQTRSAQAFSTDSLEDMAQKLVRYMVKMPPLSEGGDYAVQARTVPANPPRQQVVVFPKNMEDKSEVPIEVTVHRVEGSHFAPGMDNRQIPWGEVALGGVAEAILAPRVPVPEAEFQVQLPATDLAAGTHELTCIASTPLGSETIIEKKFTLAGRHGDFSARFSGQTFDPGESLTVFMHHGSDLADKFPKLVMDGMVVCAWPPGTIVGELPLTSPLVCPGPHDVWVEWDDADGIPAPADTWLPLAKSAVSRIFVRRPLASGAELSPETVPEGTKTVQIAGPYISSETQILANREVIQKTRNHRNPLYWDLYIKHLPPGQYVVSLVGDAATEQSQAVETPLTILP